MVPILCAVLTAMLPLAAEVDFVSLPAKGTFADYALKVKLTLSDKKDLEFTVAVTKDSDPSDARASVFAALKQTGWEVEKVGETKLRIVGKGKAHVTKVTFESAASEPVVKWTPKK